MSTVIGVVLLQTCRIQPTTVPAPRTGGDFGRGAPVCHDVAAAAVPDADGVPIPTRYLRIFELDRWAAVPDIRNSPLDLPTVKVRSDDDVKGADHAVLIAVGSVTLHLFDVVADFAVTDRRGLTPRVIVRSVDHSTP